MSRLALLALATILVGTPAIADEGPGSLAPETTVSAAREPGGVPDGTGAREEAFSFGRDLGPFGLAVDLVTVEEPGDVEPLVLWTWTVGATCAVADGLRLGAEAFGEWEAEAGATTTQAFAGPSAEVALPFLRGGAVAAAWLTVGVGFGLTGSSDEVRASATLGLDW